MLNMITQDIHQRRFNTMQYDTANGYTTPGTANNKGNASTSYVLH